jgi:hypothetical protein
LGAPRAGAARSLWRRRAAGREGVRACQWPPQPAVPQGSACIELPHPRAPPHAAGVTRCARWPLGGRAGPAPGSHARRAGPVSGRLRGRTPAAPPQTLTASRPHGVSALGAAAAAAALALGAAGGLPAAAAAAATDAELGRRVFNTQCSEPGGGGPGPSRRARCRACARARPLRPTSGHPPTTRGRPPLLAILAPPHPAHLLLPAPPPPPQSRATSVASTRRPTPGTGARHSSGARWSAMGWTQRRPLRRRHGLLGGCRGQGQWGRAGGAGCMAGGAERASARARGSLPTPAPTHRPLGQHSRCAPAGAACRPTRRF